MVVVDVVNRKADQCLSEGCFIPTTHSLSTTLGVTLYIILRYPFAIPLHPTLLCPIPTIIAIPIIIISSCNIHTYIPLVVVYLLPCLRLCLLACQNSFHRSGESVQDMYLCKGIREVCGCGWLGIIITTMMAMIKHTGVLAIVRSWYEMGNTHKHTY